MLDLLLLLDSWLQFVNFPLCKLNVIVTFLSPSCDLLVGNLSAADTFDHYTKVLGRLTVLLSLLKGWNFLQFEALGHLFDVIITYHAFPLLKELGILEAFDKNLDLILRSQTNILG